MGLTTWSRSRGLSSVRGLATTLMISAASQSPRTFLIWRPPQSASSNSGRGHREDPDDQSAGSSLLESLHDKELREQQGREKILESMISDLPGIIRAFVQINRLKPTWGLQPVAKSSVFVRLETEGDRQLPYRTVQTLTTILTGSEPGLAADAVTVVDRRGHKYLDAGNPALSALSTTGLARKN